LKTNTKARAPIITDLNYSKEEIAEVKRIQTDIHLSQKKDKIRAILHGPLCCICSLNVPTRKVTYTLGDGQGVRIETYCSDHFSIYERTANVDLNDIIASYNCVKGELPKC
jgi:hypothetical protein